MRIASLKGENGSHIRGLWISSILGQEIFFVFFIMPVQPIRPSEAYEMWEGEIVDPGEVDVARVTTLTVSG